MAFTTPTCQHNYRVVDFTSNEILVFCTKCLDVKKVNVMEKLGIEEPPVEPPVLIPSTVNVNTSKEELKKESF